MADRAQKAPTAAEVIAMFRDAVDLPVTDDGQKIADQAKTAEPRYARMKASPDAQQRNKADLWYQQIARLQNDRPALLKIVYAHFTHLADAALEAALSSGVTALTPVLHQQLRGFAEKECQCDSSLARKFVDQYLLTKKLKVLDLLVVPHLVETLTAAATVGYVKLDWQLPPVECDEVIVKRYETLSDGQFQTVGQELCRGKLNIYLDHRITAGRRYRYEVYSVWRRVISQQGVVIEVAVPVPVDVVNTYLRDKAISIRMGPVFLFAVFAVFVLFMAVPAALFYFNFFIKSEPETPAEPPKPVAATTPPMIPAEPPKPVAATTPPMIPAEPPKPVAATTPPPPIKPNLGQLILELTPPARASLDGFHHPDDGNNVAATHHFSDLEPRIYQLTVKREGYKSYTETIEIENGITKRQIHLEHD
ncbi:MAG: PEGA domain-containing protein [Candidatus Competibacteraceae bacterium]